MINADDPSRIKTDFKKIKKGSHVDVVSPNVSDDFLAIPFDPGGLSLHIVSLGVSCPPLCVFTLY